MCSWHLLLCSSSTSDSSSLARVGRRHVSLTKRLYLTCLPRWTTGQGKGQWYERGTIPWTFFSKYWNGLYHHTLARRFIWVASFSTWEKDRKPKSGARATAPAPRGTHTLLTTLHLESGRSLFRSQRTPEPPHVPGATCTSSRALCYLGPSPAGEQR